MPGFARVSWFGSNLSQQLIDKLKPALRDATEYLLQEANKDVPLDEGTLLRSGNTDVDTHDSHEVKASVYYDTMYASRLHEHPEYNFQGGRKGKWLEDVLVRDRSKVMDYIEEACNQTLGGGS